ncbi:hypothetical protein [Bradyrhizobium erythrophlei]|uniref:hypothetical protein n=1 Tax=Bradyrhizobium erythrophlei TaxID=1437360 RepID=UPI0012AB47D2|nr:hypothetical protein [Bradyrhizobium erythrophlei]
MESVASEQEAHADGRHEVERLTIVSGWVDDSKAPRLNGCGRKNAHSTTSPQRRSANTHLGSSRPLSLQDGYSRSISLDFTEERALDIPPLVLQTSQRRLTDT